MSAERYSELIWQLCDVVGLADAESALARGAIEVEGFEIALGHGDADPDALYLSFNFGTVTSGRSLRVFRLMLEANLTIYAQDQAQLGMEAESGAVLLIVRVPMSPDVDGTFLAETLDHYTEHGRYWRDNILVAEDEMYESLSYGDYTWLKA